MDTSKKTRPLTLRNLVTCLAAVCLLTTAALAQEPDDKCLTPVLKARMEQGQARQEADRLRPLLLNWVKQTGAGVERGFAVWFKHRLKSIRERFTRCQASSPVKDPACRALAEKRLDLCGHNPSEEDRVTCRLALRVEYALQHDNPAVCNRLPDEVKGACRVIADRELRCDKYKNERMASFCRMLASRKPGLCMGSDRHRHEPIQCSMYWWAEALRHRDVSLCDRVHSRDDARSCRVQVSGDSSECPAAGQHTNDWTPSPHCYRPMVRWWTWRGEDRSFRCLVLVTRPPGPPLECSLRGSRFPEGEWTSTTFRLDPEPWNPQFIHFEFPEGVRPTNHVPKVDCRFISEKLGT